MTESTSERCSTDRMLLSADEMAAVDVAALRSAST
jgi:hypothetical protein